MDGLLSSIKGERLYAICLQTADDGLSVALCANTEEGYAEKRAFEALVEEMTPEYEWYLRWAPTEWRFEAVGDENFTAVNRELTSSALGEGRGNFGTYLSGLVDAMTDALASLRAERERHLAGVTLFVTISDSEQAEEVELRSATRLNPPGLAARIAERLR